MLVQYLLGKHSVGRRAVVVHNIAPKGGKCKSLISISGVASPPGHRASFCFTTFCPTCGLVTLFKLCTRVIGTKRYKVRICWIRMYFVYGGILIESLRINILYNIPFYFKHQVLYRTNTKSILPGLNVLSFSCM